MGLFSKSLTRNSTAIGQNAEDLALQFLQSKGMQLIERNYRCKMGEIDLIMRHDAGLVFAEVRYRKHSKFGSGAETVIQRKQQKI
ncbi:MAG: YraN family protein, partial [Gammaproteobacteria bacterium]